MRAVFREEHARLNGQQRLEDVVLDAPSQLQAVTRQRICSSAKMYIVNDACDRCLLLVKLPVHLSMAVLLPADAFAMQNVNAALAATMDSSIAGLGGTAAAVLRNTRLPGPTVIERLGERINTMAKLRDCAVCTLTVYEDLGLVHPDLAATLGVFLDKVEVEVIAARLSDGVSGNGATPKQATAWKGVVMLVEDALRATFDYHTVGAKRFDVSFKANGSEVFKNGSGRWDALKVLLKSANGSHAHAAEDPAQYAPAAQRNRPAVQHKQARRGAAVRGFDDRDRDWGRNDRNDYGRWERRDERRDDRQYGGRGERRDDGRARDEGGNRPRNGGKGQDLTESQKEHRRRCNAAQPPVCYNFQVGKCDGGVRCNRDHRPLA